MRYRTSYSVIGAILAAAAFGLVAYAVVIPAGIPVSDAVAYCFAGEVGPYRNPSGTRSVWIRKLDFGAVHSGPYWVWIIDRSGLRDCALSQGYVPFHGLDTPLRWIRDDQLEVTYMRTYRSPRWFPNAEDQRTETITYR